MVLMHPELAKPGFKLHVMHVPNVHHERDAAVVELRHEGACVHLDTERRGATWNWAQMTACMASSTEDWQVQLNDDVVLLRNWRMHLHAALRFSPSPMLGLAWVGSRRGAKAVEHNRAYAVGHYLPAGLAIAYHRSVAPVLADFAAQAALTGYPHDDVLACLWAKLNGITPALVGRSIFGTLDVQSLMGHARYATAVHTIEKTGVPWAAGYVRDNHMARRDDEKAILEMMEKVGA